MIGREQVDKARNRIKGLDELASILSSLRAARKRIVHCHGVFDLLHIGHIRYFEQAKQLGDILVVTVTPDRYVDKGPQRPAFAEDLRAEAIGALHCVDYVAINAWPTAVETINLLKPDIYAKGSDYRDSRKDLTGKIVEEEAAIRSVGGKIVFTDDVVFSSSHLISRYLAAFPKEVSEYLAQFSKRYSVDHVLQSLESAKSLKTLVVGEAIVDEYQYCEQIGKSAKDPVLAVRYLSTEKFGGGILAIANHVANFCDNVGVITFLGGEDSQEDFIRQHLRSNVEPLFLYKENSPSIVKRRFVESYLLQKLFEVYEMNNRELTQGEIGNLYAKLEDVLPQYDLVIVADYGHGMMTREVIEMLCTKGRFLAVNSQANASNRGLNTISRYPRADFITLARYEIELEERNFQGTMREMLLDVTRRLHCKQILVTLGKEGNLGYRDTEGFFEAPALANQVVDRVGAGDAVLALTALCVAKQVPMEMVGFIGNVVGAEAAATLGHRNSIEKLGLYRHIKSLLK